MLFREPSHEEAALLAKTPPDPRSAADGEVGQSLSEPKLAIKSSLPNQGLYLFSLFTGRAGIQQHIALRFSYRFRLQGPHPNSGQRSSPRLASGLANTASLISKPSSERLMLISRTIPPCLKSSPDSMICAWFFSPISQYITQPNGTGEIENATIGGFETGIAFF